MKYFVCATTSCFGCPFCEHFAKTNALTNKTTFFRCSLKQQAIQNTTKIPKWCPLPNENDIMVRRFRGICYEKDK